MKDHLGRNPLKKQTQGKPASAIPRPTAAPKRSTQWLCVDLPAGIFLLTLKTALLVKSAFSPRAK